MSRKHARWDRRWLISTVQTEWQNVARGRAGEIGAMQSLCFPSCTLDSVEDGKHFYFTHQSVTSCRLRRCHHRAIKHKSLRSSAKAPEWMCVCGRPLSLITDFVTGRTDKMQITYHTHLTHSWNQFLVVFFHPQSISHHWLLGGFSNLIWQHVKLSKKKNNGRTTSLPTLPRKSPLKVETCLDFLQPNVSPPTAKPFILCQWMAPMYYRSLNCFHLLSLRCILFSLWKQ